MRLVSILLALALSVAVPAFGGTIWTDGNGDGLPDASAIQTAVGATVSIDAWIDSGDFLWTNFLVFVERTSGLTYVSASYIISGGSNTPIDTFSNPRAVGFGGYGYSRLGVTQIGSISVQVNRKGLHYFRPIIAIDNIYGTYSVLQSGASYMLFATRSNTSYQTPVGAKVATPSIETTWGRVKNLYRSAADLNSRNGGS